MDLQTFFKENPKVALGFSGGCDSSYLLYAALHYGADIKAYYIKTPFQPQFELDDALRMASQLGINITVVEHNVLSEPKVAENPADRCYYCKTALFGLLMKLAVSDGYPVLIDGTNASDDEGDRPGMRALKELSVRSPLRECGITKSEVRRLSREAGLFTWDKPAYACLATRIPTGQSITAKLLSDVENAEGVLFSMGFSDFRVRVFNGAARIQLPADQLNKALESRKEIYLRFKPYFETVLLDFCTGIVRDDIICRRSKNDAISLGSQGVYGCRRVETRHDRLRKNRIQRHDDREI
jgi:uncharacterized protein